MSYARAHTHARTLNGFIPTPLLPALPRFVPTLQAGRAPGGAVLHPGRLCGPAVHALGEEVGEAVQRCWAHGMGLHMPGWWGYAAGQLGADGASGAARQGWRPAPGRHQFCGYGCSHASFQLANACNALPHGRRAWQALAWTPLLGLPGRFAAPTCAQNMHTSSRSTARALQPAAASYDLPPSPPLQLLAPLNRENGNLKIGI